VIERSPVRLRAVPLPGSLKANSAFHPSGVGKSTTCLRAGARAGRVHLCRVAGNTVIPYGYPAMHRPEVELATYRSLTTNIGISCSSGVEWSRTDFTGVCAACPCDFCVVDRSVIDHRSIAVVTCWRPGSHGDAGNWPLLATIYGVSARAQVPHSLADDRTIR